MGKRMEKRDAWDADEPKKRELDQKIALAMEEESGNLYRDYEKARRTMSVGGRRIAMLGVFLAGALLLTILLLPWGVLVAPTGGIRVPQWTYTVAQYKDLVISRAGDFITFITTGGAAGMGTIICSVVVAIVAGYGMSVTGAVYQGLFRNPMASPTTMGVNAGGILGGIVYIIFLYDSNSYAGWSQGFSENVDMNANSLIRWYYSMNIFQRSAQSLCVLAGCFAGVLLILAISVTAGRGKISTVALLLAGSVFSTVITEAGQLIQYYMAEYGEDDGKSDALSTLIGGTYLGGDFTWGELFLLGVPVLVVSIIVFAFSDRINIIVFGEEEARAMGINTTHLRHGLIVLCTILSAFVLSFCGQVAMVGFIAPHLARYLVGPDFKKLVPASALLGGIITLLVYDICYMMAATSKFNMYTGVICSILSALFIILYRRNRHADWS